MARVIFLGSAAAVSDAEHDNTHFMLVGEESTVLVDCGSNPLGKLYSLGINDEDVRDIIVTHFHPDHVAGVPNMLMHMWQQGRHLPLRFYGLNHCISRIEDMMMAFSWDTWPNFFPVNFERVLERNCAPVLETPDFQITCWPTKHNVPTIGLRVVNKRNDQVLAYSCDTEPFPALLELAADADVLIHEAAGAIPGHSSAVQAGEIATRAGAKSLYLVHYQVWNVDPRPLIDEAKTTYKGPVYLVQDYDETQF